LDSPNSADDRTSFFIGSIASLLVWPIGGSRASCIRPYRPLRDSYTIRVDSPPCLVFGRTDAAVAIAP